jgi:hypothetical protein
MDKKPEENIIDFAEDILDIELSPILKENIDKIIEGKGKLILVSSRTGMYALNKMLDEYCQFMKLHS